MVEQGGRVLHLVDSAGMYGAERVILTLLAQLEHTPFAGILGCIREDSTALPEIAVRAGKEGIPVEYFTMHRGFSLRGRALIWDFIKDNGVSFVHSHGYKTDMYLGLRFRNDVKLVSTVHGWPGPGMGLKWKVYEILDMLALRRFDAVVAVSLKMNNKLSHRIPKKNIHTIYNGIYFGQETSELRDDLKRRLGIPGNRRIVGCLGRLAPVKGLEFLIDAMPQVLEKSDCELVIAGNGVLREHLEEQVRTLGISERVRFLGYLEDVYSFLGVLDVLVMPSLSEGLPMTLLEAAALGVSIVATKVGGIPEVIRDGEEGTLVEPRNAGALCTAILQVMEDAEYAQRTAKAARETVREKFSAPAMAEGYVRLYSSLSGVITNEKSR